MNKTRLFGFLAAFLVLFTHQTNLPASNGHNIKEQIAIAFKTPMGTSANWAGYAATSGSYTAVSGTWNVPKVKSSDKLEADATWVGIGGVNSQDLIQSGTQAITENRQIEYQAWIEMLPDPPENIPVKIRPGDIVAVSIDRISGNKWHISFVDKTNGKKYEKTANYSSSLSSAEWIEEAPTNDSSVMALDKFAKIKFISASTVKNGHITAIAKSGAKPIAISNDSGKIIAKPSAIAKNSGSFYVTRSNIDMAVISDAHKNIFSREWKRTSAVMKNKFRTGSLGRSPF